MGDLEQEMTKRMTPFTDVELEEFRTIIMEKRGAAREDIDRMLAQLHDAREQMDNDSAYSFHMADAGTDAMEREKLYLMIARLKDYVKKLDLALERIDKKTYGVCRVTGNPISKERLRAVPHTQISIQAKLKEKRQ